MKKVELQLSDEQWDHIKDNMDFMEERDMTRYAFLSLCLGDWMLAQIAQARYVGSYYFKEGSDKATFSMCAGIFEELPEDFLLRCAEKDPNAPDQDL